MKANSLPSNELNFYCKAIKRSENLTDPVLIQRFESITIAVFAIVLYANLDASWWLFGALILTPDVSLLAYLISVKVGSKIYNIFHNYSLPLIIATLSFLFSFPFAMEVALIWITHIAIDRSLGYGLKFPTNFKHTHLSWK